MVMSLWPHFLPTLYFNLILPKISNKMKEIMRIICQILAHNSTIPTVDHRWSTKLTVPATVDDWFITLTVDARTPHVASRGSDSWYLLNVRVCTYCVAMFVGTVMFFCTLSLLMSVIVLNLHHRTPKTHYMPNWVYTSSALPLYTRDNRELIVTFLFPCCQFTFRAFSCQV